MLGFVCAILFGWATVRGARLAGDLRVRHLLRTGTRLPGRVVDAVFGRTYNPRGPSRAFVDVTVAFDDGGPRTLSVRYVWWQPYDRITEEMRSRWFSMRSDRTPVTVVRGRHGGYATDLDRRRMAISSRW